MSRAPRACRLADIGTIPRMRKVNKPTDSIRCALDSVSQLRVERAASPELRQAVSATKSLQSQRFSGTYSDLLTDANYAAAARFFLDELYADRDFSARDTQFSRIASTLPKVFPAAVVGTACALADLHALTEELDQAVATALVDSRRDQSTGSDEASRYLFAWRKVGHEAQRRHQLQAVLALGEDLARLTRTPGLRTLLKLMRRPAHAAGMGALQQFLEAGFDTFAALTKQPGGAQAFLDLIAQREGFWLDTLFHASLPDAANALRTTLQHSGSGPRGAAILWGQTVDR